MDDIIEETIKAGVHGPAVTIFVVMALLCLAEKQGAESADEVRSCVALNYISTIVIFDTDADCFV